jgi:hypothetical protein
MRRIFLTAGAALVLVAPVTAQSKPDFSGTWIVVADQGARSASRGAGQTGSSTGADPAVPPAGTGGAAMDFATYTALAEARAAGDSVLVRALTAAVERANAMGVPARRGNLQALAGLGPRVTIVQSSTTLTLTRSTSLGPIETVVNLDGSQWSRTVEWGDDRITQTSTGVWEGDKLVINTTIVSDAGNLRNPMTLSRVGDELVVERSAERDQPMGTQRFIKAP